MKTRDDYIKEMAAKVRSKLMGATLLGAPIDQENIDHLIVAAYVKGQNEIWPAAADDETSQPALT